MKMKLIKVPNRSDNPKKPPAHIIKREVFDHYYLKLGYTQKEFTNKLKINHRVFRRSLHHYYSQDEIERNRHERCSLSAKKRDPSTQHRGPRDPLDKKTLKDLYEKEKLSIREICRVLDTTPFKLETNLRYHDISRRKKGKYSRAFEEIDLDILERLDTLSPGLMNLVREGYLDQKLEVAKSLFLLYQELTWYRNWIKNRILRLRKKLNAQGISLTSHGIYFAQSSLETKMAFILEELGEDFIPQYKITQRPHSKKYFYYDFLLPSHKIIIECDGIHFHSGRKKKEADLLKQQRAEESGFRVIRFTDQEILKTPKECEKEIHEAFSNSN